MSKNAYLLVSGDNVWGVFTSKKAASAVHLESDASLVVVQVPMNELFESYVQETSDSTPVEKAPVKASSKAAPASSSKTAPVLKSFKDTKVEEATPVKTTVKAPVLKSKAVSLDDSAPTTRGESAAKKAEAAAEKRKPASNTCCRVKRGKTDPCGAAAKNEHEGEWFCNPCFKIVAKDSSEDGSKSSSKTPAKKATSKVSDIQEKIPAVLKKFEQVQGKITPLPHRLPDGTFLHIYDEPTVGKLVFDKPTKSVTGLFKNGAVVPLSSDAIRWCESANIKIQTQDISDDESAEDSKESVASEEEAGSDLSDDEPEEEASEDDE